MSGDRRLYLTRASRAAVVMFVAVAGLDAACARAPRADTATARAASPATAGATVPHIDRVTPDSVHMASGYVAEVLIAGRGFAPGRPGMNTVQFAGTSINQVPANDAGTEVRFVIPDALDGGGGARPTPIMTGSYDVQIKTAAGTSNTATIRIYR